MVNSVDPDQTCSVASGLGIHCLLRTVCPKHRVYTLYLSAGTGNEEVLNQVALPILPDADCSAQFRAFVPAKEICAGYTNGGKDFCSVNQDLTTIHA